MLAYLLQTTNPKNHNITKPTPHILNPHPKTNPFQQPTRNHLSFPKNNTSTIIKYSSTFLYSWHAEKTHCFSYPYISDAVTRVSGIAAHIAQENFALFFSSENGMQSLCCNCSSCWVNNLISIFNSSGIRVRFRFLVMSVLLGSSCLGISFFIVC